MSEKHEKPQAGHNPQHNPSVDAERAREAQESQEAREAQASNREHMVDIGRGNQQAGRQTKS